MFVTFKVEVFGAFEFWDERFGSLKSHSRSQNVLIPHRDRFDRDGVWIPGYTFHPATVDLYFQHSVTIFHDDVSREDVIHKFALVRYQKPLESRRVFRVPPCGYARVSNEKHIELRGDNIVPVHLVFARYLAYEESRSSVIVIPLIKKWLDHFDPSGGASVSAHQYD